MISGKKRIELSCENILKKITDYDIFRLYFPGNWKINQVTYSPFRNEKAPSFLIGNKLGHLHFIDYGDTSLRGGCFDYVQKIYNISLHEALLKIDRDFGLGLSSAPIKDYKHIVSEYKQPEELGKRYSLIQVITKKYTKEELSYWEQYSISLEDLRKENIYSIKKAYLNKQLFNCSQLTFGYLYEDQYFKLYQPLENKRKKWLSNVPLTCLDGKENITNCETAWITKSKKDKIILAKIYPNVASTQNESIACFSEENVDFIKNNSKKQIIFYDSDSPGVQASQLITKTFNFDYCNPPKNLLPDIKDFSDMTLKYSLKEVEKYIKNKLLL